MTAFGSMVLFGLLAIQGTGFVQCERFHETLTEEEFTKVFRTTRDNVPEYDVAPIMHDLHKRHATDLNLQFIAFDREYNIHLNPPDGILAGEMTPVWVATAIDKETVKYTKLKSNIVGSVAKSFVAPSSLASFVVAQSSSMNNPGFHGNYENLRIAPLPARVQGMAKEEVKRLKRQVPRPSRTLIPTDYHVIIKTKASPRDPIALEKQVNTVSQHFNESDAHRRKRFANDIIYPSILIITDHYSEIPVSVSESEVEDEIRYQLAFWNSVDLRYWDLESPKVRLRIAGIVIGLGRPATPYIYNFSNDQYVDAFKSMEAISVHWTKQKSNPDFQPGAYNIIMTLTSAKLMEVGVQGQKHIMGVTRFASLCQNLATDNVTARGIIHDTMNFDGINTAAHEIGHILGADHDPNDTGPCGNDLGFIMASHKYDTINMHAWSRCSLQHIQFYLGTADDCPRQPAEKNSPGKPIERIVPGDIFTAEEQCHILGYASACEPSPDMCQKLICWSTNTGWFRPPACMPARVGALDGTPCAPGSLCVRGLCRRGKRIVG